MFNLNQDVGSKKAASLVGGQQHIIDGDLDRKDQNDGFAMCIASMQGHRRGPPLNGNLFAGMARVYVVSSHQRPGRDGTGWIPAWSVFLGGRALIGVGQAIISTLCFLTLNQRGPRQGLHCASGDPGS